MYKIWVIYLETVKTDESKEEKSQSWEHSHRTDSFCTGRVQDYIVHWVCADFVHGANA